MTRHSRLLLRAVAAGIAAVTAFSVAGCGASIADLPLPGSYVPGPTYGWTSSSPRC